MASALPSAGGTIPSQRVVRTAGGLTKGGDGLDSIPRSSFIQVPLATQSEQLSKGRKVFEELSAFAKERFQTEEKTAHAGLRASRLSASEYEIPGRSLQKGFIALRRFCANESRQHSVLARQMQEQFYQPLEQAMSRHADMVMRAKLGVQRSAQLVQESENRLAKAKRQLAKAQGDEKQHREALARGRQDARSSRKDIEWLTNRAARALDSARHAEAIVLGERHQLLQAIKNRDEAVAGAARSFEAAERERAVTAARAIACFTARQREFYAAQTRDLDSLGQVVENFDPDGDIDAFIEEKKVPDSAPFYRVALYLLDWARSDQPSPQQQQKRAETGAHRNGQQGDEGSGGNGIRDIETLLWRLIPNQPGGGRKTRPKVSSETAATGVHATATNVVEETETRKRSTTEGPEAVAEAEVSLQTSAAAVVVEEGDVAKEEGESLVAVEAPREEDSRSEGSEEGEGEGGGGPTEEAESAEAARIELEKLLQSEEGRSRFLQALNERRSVATEVTPEAYDALVETFRVFLDGCSPRSQRSWSRNRSRSRSRSRSSSRSGVDEPSAAGVIAMNELSSSSSSSSLSSFPLGGAFVGSRGEADKEDDDDVIMVEEGGEEGHVLLSRSSMNSTLLPSPASSAKSPENFEREGRDRKISGEQRSTGRNGFVRGTSSSTPGDTVTPSIARPRAMSMRSTTSTKSPTRSPTQSTMNTVATSPPRVGENVTPPVLQRRNSLSGEGGGKNILDFAASIVRGENRSQQQRGVGVGPFQRGGFRGGGSSVIIPGGRGGEVATMASRMGSRFGSASSSSLGRHQDLASRQESDEAALQKVVEAALGRGQGMTQFSGRSRGGRRGSRVAASGGGREDWWRDWEEREMDIRSARQAMILANTFFKTEQKGERPERIYLLRQLRDHPLWRHPRFWDEALMMGVKEQLIEGPAVVRWDDLQGEGRRDAVARTHNVVFSQLASIAFNMLECGIEGARVRSEVTRKCRESQLGEAQVQELLRDLSRRIHRAEQDPKGVDRLPSWWSIVADDSSDMSPSIPVSKTSTPSTAKTLASITPQLGRREAPPPPSSTLARSPPRSSTTTPRGDVIGDRGSRSRSDSSALAAERAGRNLAAVSTASSRIQQHERQQKQTSSPPPPQQQQQEQKYSAEMEFVREAAELGNRRRRRSPKPRRPPLQAPVTALMPLEVEKRSPRTTGGVAGASPEEGEGERAQGVTVMTDEDEYDML